MHSINPICFTVNVGLPRQQSIEFANILYNFTLFLNTYNYTAQIKYNGIHTVVLIFHLLVCFHTFSPCIDN